MPRPGVKPEVKYTVSVVQDDVERLHGSFSCGDDALDHEIEKGILARLDCGDVWAWADVTVTAECEGFKGTDALCGCSYDDEDDFRANSGYFDDMCKRALDNLRATLVEEIKRGNDALALHSRFATQDFYDAVEASNAPIVALEWHEQTCIACGAHRSNSAPGSVCALCNHVMPAKEG